ncbi:hypothetical protein ACEE44_08950 [Streptococcus sp. 32226D021BW]|nr:hypothetical protein [Streptococcus suis]
MEEFFTKFVSWTVELYNADKVALVSLCISLVVGLFTWINKSRQDKKDEIRQDAQDKINKEARRLDQNFKDFQMEFSKYQQQTNELQFSIENRSDLIPYFHLNRTESHIEYDSQQNIFVKIYLTNVGRGTATNITTCPISKDTSGNNIYFIIDPRLTNEATHCFHDYFSENFAIPNSSISLEISEIAKNKNQSYFLKFKIRFSDVIGREYEQEFRFGYDNQIVHGINQNSTSYPPKLVKDIRREEN